MKRYATKAYRDGKCVRHIDSWNVIAPSKVYQRSMRDFPGALVQIYGPDNKTVAPFDEGIFPESS